MSVLIWLQTVCKGYQQMTKMAAKKERVQLNFVVESKNVYYIGLIQVFIRPYYGMALSICWSINNLQDIFMIFYGNVY